MFQYILFARMIIEVLKWLVSALSPVNYTERSFVGSFNKNSGSSGVWLYLYAGIPA